jgi:hypothetical protein
MKGFRTQLVFAAMACAVSFSLEAQEVRIFNRTVQVHGFASQGYVKTNQNNWLTMNTANGGSGQFTDFGGNATTTFGDNLRVGAQFYDRRVGQLGTWHPLLDWASADYKFRSWLGFRGGKVKTVMGLYNDTQDMDSLHTFALLPQSIYPTDMRDATLAHVGGDLYGRFQPGRKLGHFAYTVFGGDNIQGVYGGYPFLLTVHGIYLNHSSGPVWGGDLRWNTPARGLLVGASYENDQTTNTGTMNPSVALRGPDVTLPYWEKSRKDFTEQFYSDYTRDNLRVDAEYRRYSRDFAIFNGQFEANINADSWYTSGTYQVAKWLDLGGYYSSIVTSWIVTVPGQVESPGKSEPDRHIYDKVVVARFDYKGHYYTKVEGHFMDGYGADQMYPGGFYLQDNLKGLQPTTNGLIVRTGVDF